MIVLEFEQGTPEWYQARLGIPTASGFDKIITPAGAPSRSAKEYQKQLAGEWMAGGVLEEEQFESFWMTRGKSLEPEARAAYEFWSDEKVKQVGFVFRDAMRDVGCSPDGLTETGGWENKCPKMATHVGYLLGGVVPSCYKPQVQGCMWICDRQHWDFMSYHPATEPMIIRVERDEDFIRKLAKLVGAFNTELRAIKQKLEKYRL